VAKQYGTIKSTNIGSKGPIKGSMQSGHGPAWGHLPRANSHSNAQVKERSIGSPRNTGSNPGPKWSHIPKQTPTIKVGKR
jgi:hypothetical protein